MTEKLHSLNTLEERANKHMQVALDLSKQDTNAVLHQPGPQRWSAIQCLDHLNSYSMYYLPALQNALNRSVSNVKQQTLSSSWVGRYFEKLMNPASSKSKFKAFKDYTPTSDLDADSVIKKFIMHQEQLIHCINLAKALDTDSKQIPISIFKYLKLTVGDVLRFMVMHEERHIQQALKALDAVTLLSHT